MKVKEKKKKKMNEALVKEVVVEGAVAKIIKRK